MFSEFTTRIERSADIRNRREGGESLTLSYRGVERYEGSKDRMRTHE